MTSDVQVCVREYVFGKDHGDEGYCSDGAFEIEPYYQERVICINCSRELFTDDGFLPHRYWPDALKEDQIRESCSSPAGSQWHPTGREPYVVTRIVEIQLLQ